MDPLQLIAEMLAGERDLAFAEQAFASQVTLHMGGLTSKTTPGGWSAWVRFMREEGRVEELVATLERMEDHADGTVSALGRWHGLRQGQVGHSELCAPRYRVVGDQVVELWTAPGNYQFAFGRLARTWGGFAWVVLRYKLWRRRADG